MEWGQRCCVNTGERPEGVGVGAKGVQIVSGFSVRALETREEGNVLKHWGAETTIAGKVIVSFLEMCNFSEGHASSRAIKWTSFIDAIFMA